VIDIEETEEQAATRVLTWRAQAALRDAPALMMHMRELIPTPERGETDQHMWSPMRLNPTDDSDAFYSTIVNWVMAWAEYLQITPPAAAIAWRKNDQDARGFRAGTTPESAQLLTRLQTGWLLDNFETITLHQFAGTFLDDVVEQMTTIRGRYPLAPRRPRPVSLAACPLCHEPSVGADWMGYELTYVQIRCESCGWIRPNSPKPAELLKWLKTFIDVAPPLSQECETGDHRACSSTACSCTCHDWAAVAVGVGQQTPVRDTGRVIRFPASTTTPDPAVCPVCHLYHPAGACQ
jgi:hypothetical protein